MTIRQYSPSDKQAVSELHNVALEATGASYPGPWDNDLQDIERIYIQSGGEFLVGELDGHIVAMGALKPINPTTAELKRMRVQPEYQRMGFGQLMLDRLESRAKQLGYHVIELDTTVQQVAARKLYEKNGYVNFGEREKSEFVELLFRKVLQPGDITHAKCGD